MAELNSPSKNDFEEGVSFAHNNADIGAPKGVETLLALIDELLACACGKRGQLSPLFPYLLLVYEMLFPVLLFEIQYRFFHYLVPLVLFNI